MLVLNAFEDGELASRSHMDFEASHAIDDVIVDALAVPTIRLSAGLPVAFENIPWIVRERRELRSRGAHHQQCRRSEQTG